MNIHQTFRKAATKLLQGQGGTRHSLHTDGLTYFREQVMDSAFDWTAHRRERLAYYEQWGFHFSRVEAAYYERVNGIASDLYLPVSFYFNLLLPYLNSYMMEPTYQNKCLFGKMLHADASGRGKGYRVPETVVSCMNGHYYDRTYRDIPADEALRLVTDQTNDLIIKPSVGSMGGHGVHLIAAAGKTASSAEAMMKAQGKDFIVQHKVGQHEAMARLNPTSVNTLRIVTYRQPDGRIKMLHAIVRFGGDGAVVDNGSAGGGFTPITPDGTLSGRKIYQLRKLDTGRSLPHTVDDQIPHFDRAREVAIHLHRYLPYFALIGWDIAIDQEGTPCVIEYNTRPVLTMMQMCQGPLFDRAELDELMPKVMKYHMMDKVQTRITFADRPGFDNLTDHLFD